MALREIRKDNDEILRKTSRKVEKIDEKVLMLLEDMAETMYNTSNGAGLAAPQVGILKRIIVVDVGEGLMKLINPEIIEKSGEKLDVEGCLSVPGIWGKVLRPETVTVKALNEKGEEVIINATGNLTKCLCHEIDHLNGILFTDLVVEYVELKK